MDTRAGPSEGTDMIADRPIYLATGWLAQIYDSRRRRRRSRDLEGYPKLCNETLKISLKSYCHFSLRHLEIKLSCRTIKWAPCCNFIGTTTTTATTTWTRR